MNFVFRFVFIFIISISFINAQTKTENCEKIPFHFLVIGSESYTPVSRQVSVFLDEKAYSEKNLKNLFDYLSKQYTDKKILIIDVATNWKQLPLPVDCSLGASGISDASDQKPENFEFHYARYYRNENTEYFIFNPTLKTEDFKKVIIQSKK